MPVDVQTKKLKQFRDFSPLIALGALGLILFASLISIFFRRTLVNRSINISPQESFTLEPIQLKKNPVGALRIDVSAEIPANRWITYEIALLDAQGNLLASAMKQAWRESISQSKQDLQGGLDIRSAEGEPVTIKLSVVEYGTVAGETLSGSATLRLLVQNGVVDTRYFVVGILATLFMSALTAYSVRTSGKLAIKKFINDSDLGGRAVMGGADSLIKTVVEVTSDETSPRKFTVEFSIQDQNGEEVYYHEFKLNRSNVQVNEAYNQSLKVFFLLDSRESYRFYLEVVPDGPIDRTRLTVHEGVRTVFDPDVIHIQN